MPRKRYSPEEIVTKLRQVDVMTSKGKLIAAKVKASEGEARAANAAAQFSDAEAEIAFLKLTIDNLRRELYGQRSERRERLLDELEARATED